MVRIHQPLPGSPPHTRGILPSVLICALSLRFTPAYAGNTHRQRVIRRAAWVHPRIRGEYWPNPASALPRQGSPPHTRGILVKFCFGVIVGRFTPAYAGNTRSRDAPSAGPQVHPRIRGEYGDYMKVTQVAEGSPPHTRGIQRIHEFAAFRNGFTPAYAGNTGTGSERGRSPWVHPRIRGEYCCTIPLKSQ